MSPVLKLLTKLSVKYEFYGLRRCEKIVYLSKWTNQTLTQPVLP